MNEYEDVIGYKSPIEVIVEKMRTEYDEATLRAVQNVGIYVEKDELIKALRYDRDQYDHGYQKGLFDGYEQGKKETATEIYRQLMGHGTTYVKKWIKNKYGVEVEE